MPGLLQPLCLGEVDVNSAPFWGHCWELAQVEISNIHQSQVYIRAKYFFYKIICSLAFRLMKTTGLKIPQTLILEEAEF